MISFSGSSSPDAITPEPSYSFLNLDTHFAAFILRHAAVPSIELRCAALLLSNALFKGHVCFDLSSVASQPVVLPEIPDLTYFPNVDTWQSKLKISGVVGEKGDFLPLILQGTRLYLHRYFVNESFLAGSIILRARDNCAATSTKQQMALLKAFFPETGEGIDWQKKAAETAMSGNLTIISGGPGTGKTTTVAKIISLLIAQNSDVPMKIALTAPTGKAAARLKAAVGAVAASLDMPQHVREQLPVEASTIHRLLGVRPDSSLASYNEKNPLPYDVVIVDEASMIDCMLMAKLFLAISHNAKVVLLGDKDQLSSVEAGAVFADICSQDNLLPYAFNSTKNLLATRVVSLTKSHRFSSESGIGRLASYINSGDADAAWEYLKTSNDPGIVLREMPTLAVFKNEIKDKELSQFNAYDSKPLFSDAYKTFESFRVLCALRSGPYGSDAINQLIEQHLTVTSDEHGLFHGKPVMITKNDPDMGLYNGDVGLIWKNDRCNYDACFPDSDSESFRSFYPLLLPLYETAFATTVHKSQGSEFNHVVIVLPPYDSPVLTRELLYTGITRAKKIIELYCTQDVFKNAVGRKVERMSGMRETLWGK